VATGCFEAVLRRASSTSPLHKELIDDGGLRTSFREDTDGRCVSYSLFLFHMLSLFAIASTVPCAYSMA